MTSQSAFNRRVRRLWGGFILLQQAVAQHLVTAQDCEIIDCVPVPVARGARSFHPGWLADIARIGKGGNDRYFYGLRLLVALSASGVATGWVMAAGNVQERWLAELLLSSRVGRPQLSGPQDLATHQPRLTPPSEWLGPTHSSGAVSGKLIISDLGFSGQDWLDHWSADYNAEVLPAPKKAGPTSTRWFSSLRQVVETAFANLTDSFGLKYPGAHITWGLITRIAAKIAAYNVGILINRSCARPDFAFPTLIA